jgi:hypothetical protein
VESTVRGDYAQYELSLTWSSYIVAVEKPFTCTSQEADQLIATAKKVGKIVAPFQSTYLTTLLHTTTN